MLNSTRSSFISKSKLPDELSHFLALKGLPVGDSTSSLIFSCVQQDGCSQKHTW